jgi:hypothetical protein
MDFTLKKYKELLHSLLNEKYAFQTYDDFLENPKDKSIVLRHDVDLLPENSLAFAKIQSALGIKGSYYFRIVPESWDEKIIKEIAEMGHEVGYHYETMDTSNGNIDDAYQEFKVNLEKLRALVTVNTICMHGSPRSKFDNKDIWNKYSYKDLGIIGEPYYDTNFDEVFYLTDTGRCWDGMKMSIRDKVPQQSEWNSKGLMFHTTDEVITRINAGNFPPVVMFTFHPQRWHDNRFLWIKEMIFQTLKNQIKKLILANKKA